MRHQFSVQVGPRAFRIGSAWAHPIDQMRALYRDYPEPEQGLCDYTVRLEPAGPLRRWLRPSVAIRGDHSLPDAVPVSLDHALLAAEMGMNLQVALGERQFLLLHAASVERDGRVLILTGESGSGKSTLAAMLGEQGWRLMGDEFALIDPATGEAHPFLRPVSLKNEAVAAMHEMVGVDRFGPLLAGTPKGDIRHCVPNSDALSRMTEAGQPALILFPRFGYEQAVRPVDPAECFVRLTQASTNYTALAERGFAALTTLVGSIPALAIDYASGTEGMNQVEQLWAEQAR
jgi:HprK-related kinase A